MEGLPLILVLSMTQDLIGRCGVQCIHRMSRSQCAERQYRAQFRNPAGKGPIDEAGFRKMGPQWISKGWWEQRTEEKGRK